MCVPVWACVGLHLRTDLARAEIIAADMRPLPSARCVARLAARAAYKEGHQEACGRQPRRARLSTRLLSCGWGGSMQADQLGMGLRVSMQACKVGQAAQGDPQLRAGECEWGGSRAHKQAPPMHVPRCRACRHPSDNACTHLGHTSGAPAAWCARDFGEQHAPAGQGEDSMLQLTWCSCRSLSLGCRLESSTCCSRATGSSAGGPAAPALPLPWLLPGCGGAAGGGGGAASTAAAPPIPLEPPRLVLMGSIPMSKPARASTIATRSCPQGGWEGI